MKTAMKQVRQGDARPWFAGPVLGSRFHFSLSWGSHDRSLSAYLPLSATSSFWGDRRATRRNALIIFMSIELMLNAVNLTFVCSPEPAHGRADLRVLQMAVATAE
jgi:hypothetical protein